MRNVLLEQLKSEGAKYGWGLILIRREELIQLLGKLVSKFGRVRVLDVGCYGCLLRGFLEGVFGDRVEYVGVDVVDKRDFCVEGGFYLMSGESLLFPPSTFHAVLFIESLEHIPNYVLALREAYRVLKPGGAVFIQAVRVDQPNATVDETHYHVLHPKTLARLLKYLGFENVEYTDKETFAVWGFKA